MDGKKFVVPPLGGTDFSHKEVTYMFSKMWLINICLAGLAIFFGTKTHEIWVRGEKAVPKMQVAQKTEPSSRVSERAVKKRVPSESSYEVVATRTLFSPERAEFIPPEPDPEPDVMQLSGFGKKITLYGVVMMGDYKSALVSNPFNEPGERQNKWVKAGDTIGQLDVTEIQKERILLAEKGEKYEILLYDKNKSLRNKRTAGKKIKKAVKPTIVVSESKKQPESGISKTKGNSESRKTSDIEYETFDTPFGKMKQRKKRTSASDISEKKVSPGTSGNKEASDSGLSGNEESADSDISENKESAGPGFEWFDTPFGKMKRRIK